MRYAPLLLLMLAVVSVFANIPFVSNYAFWVAIAAYVILNWSPNWPGMLSLLVLMLAVVGVFIDISVVSNYAFWFAIAAYVIRDWTFNTATAPLLVWTGVLSLLLLGIAVVGVFIEIPFVSNYAFWVAIAAYMIRLMVTIPGYIPHRIGTVP
jgi:hypothetical protein